MLQYVIKFSISLAVLYIFYRAVLRPLTFYQWNRFYLLCYSLLSFVIPFIDITSWIQVDTNKELVNIIPAINIYNIGAASEPAKELSLFQRLTTSDWLLIVFCLGVLVMSIKLIVQYLSLRNIRSNAVLIETSADVQLYETAAAVSPFSFGNAIYFNRQLHTDEELQRIIQHEFVHVKQKHTVDLLIGELLCVINWFNPFAWLIRYSIRQNLEFIADNNVVANGLDKKEYQYLLLKVVGVPQYSIANNFNFSNLKKRIAMMNKMKSASLHLTKFLFVLPLLAVLLLAFRSKIKTENDEPDAKVNIAGLVVDVISMEPIANAMVFCKEKNVTAVTNNKGYYVLQLPYEDKPVEFTLQITRQGYGSFQSTENWDKHGNSIVLFGIGKGLKNGNGFSMHGGITPEKEGLNYETIALKMENIRNGMKGNKSVWNDTVPVAAPPVPFMDAVPPPPPPVQVSEPNSKGYIITIADNSGECIVLVKNKQQEIIKAMTLVEWNKNKENNESQYGMVPPRPAAPIFKLDYIPADPSIVNIVDPLPANVSNIVTANHINKEKGTQTNTATVTLKNGKKESYNLDNPDEKAAFTKKYGKHGELRMHAAPPVPAVPPIQIADTLKKPLIIVDGVIQVQDYSPNSIDASKISSVNVLKGPSAVAVYGAKAANGAILVTMKKPSDSPVKTDKSPGLNVRMADPNKVQSVSVLIDKLGDEMALRNYKVQPAGTTEIKIKQDTGYFPKDVLVIIDGKEIPNGSKIADYVQAANIESMVVLKDKTATDKYGDKAKNGVIEITTKAPVKSVIPATANATLIWKDKKDINKPGIDKNKAGGPIVATANTIYIKKSHLIVTGGSISIKGKTTVAKGELSFEHDFADMPLVMYNGKEITDTKSFKVAKASYNLLCMDEKQGLAKYGVKAKYGALEINRL